MRDDKPAMVLECAKDDNYRLFDVLADRTSGPEFEYAHPLVVAMCNRCPIKKACHTEHRREDWLKGLKKGAVKRTACAHCGKLMASTPQPKVYCNSGCSKTAKRREIVGTSTPDHVREKRATRAEDLRNFIEVGATLHDACRAFGISPDALWKWCKHHDHRDLYQRLDGSGGATT
jgi:hypothetical protein